jgi:hypothetical protein
MCTHDTIIKGLSWTNSSKAAKTREGAAAVGQTSNAGMEVTIPSSSASNPSNVPYNMP